MIKYLNVRIILKFKYSYLKSCLNHYRTKIENVTVIIWLEQKYKLIYYTVNVTVFMSKRHSTSKSTVSV